MSFEMAVADSTRGCIQEESLSKTKAKQTAAEKTRQFRAQLDTQVRRSLCSGQTACGVA